MPTETYVTIAGLEKFPVDIVYASSQLGFRLRNGAEGTTKIKIRTPNGEAISTQDYTVGVPTSPPSVSRINPELRPVNQWIYVNGTNLVGNITIKNHLKN